MPLEFIADVSDPVILMYSSHLVHWQVFHSGILDLMQGKIESFGVHQLPGWEGVGGCRLLAKRSTRDSGLWRVGDAEFECSLTPLWWHNCEGLVDAFMNNGGWSGDRRMYVTLPYGDPDLEWCLCTHREW